MKRRPSVRISPVVLGLVGATVVAAIVAVATNSLVAYFILAGFAVSLALLALQSSSPTYQRYQLGDDPTAAAEERWKLD